MGILTCLLREILAHNKSKEVAHNRPSGPADWVTGTVRIDPLLQANAPRRRERRQCHFRTRGSNSVAHPSAGSDSDCHSRLRLGAARGRSDRGDSSWRCDLVPAQREALAWCCADNGHDAYCHFQAGTLNAKTVAYVGAGTSGRFFLGLLERLGIANGMKDKLRRGSVAESISAVAKGEVEIVVMPIPLILGASGVDLAGAVATEYQDQIVLVAGLSAAAPQAAAGQALIEYLLTADPEVLKAKGYERTVK
jgi:hypothetical protein